MKPQRFSREKVKFSYSAISVNKRSTITNNILRLSFPLLSPCESRRWAVPPKARKGEKTRLKRETKKHIERPSSHIREHSWAGKNLAINIRYTQTSNRGAVTSRKIFFSFLKDSQYLRLIAENLRRIFSNIFRTELRTLKFFYSYRYSTNSDIFLSSFQNKLH